MKRLVMGILGVFGGCGGFDYGAQAFSCGGASPLCPDGYACQAGRCVRGGAAAGRPSSHAPADPTPPPGPQDAAVRDAAVDARGGDAGTRQDAGALADAAPMGSDAMGPGDAPSRGPDAWLPSLCATDEDCGTTHCCAHMASIGGAGRCVPLSQPGAREACAMQ